MTNKLTGAAQEVVSFLRGDCRHDWEYGPNTLRPGVIVKTCLKCGVRITSFTGGETAK
jgi:hypothetical protein